MNRSLITKLLVPILLLLIAIPIVSVGCEQEERQPPGPYPTELTKTVVPNVPLDIYLYAKQASPTVIPAKLTNASLDVSVESLAIWGVPAKDDFTFGAALTLPSRHEASEVYSEIKLEKDSWKKLSDDVIYVVYGSGPAAESIKKAISNNDFKYYDDNEGLQSLGFLASEGTTKMAAVAIAKPSDELMRILTADASVEGQDLLSLVLKLGALKVISGGLYAPNQIDVEKTADLLSSGASLSKLDVGVLLLIRSRLPSFILQPALKKVLTDQGFIDITLGELTLLKGTLNIDTGKVVHVIVRIEGSDIFVAVSGQDNYTKTLINSVKLK